MLLRWLSWDVSADERSELHLLASLNYQTKEGKMKRALWSAVVLHCIILCSGPLAFAEECRGTEGFNGEWQIKWSNTGNTCACSGSGETWAVTQTSSSGKTMTAAITVYRGYKGKGFIAVKREVTDGNDCNYIGEVKGDMAQGQYGIKGQYFCKNGGPYNWEVTCTK